MTLDDRVTQFADTLIALRRLQDEADIAFLDSLGGLSLQQLNILNIVGDREPCTMSEIAKQAHLSLSSITSVVDKMVKAKLMDRYRSEDDRRIVYAKLSQEGKRIYEIQIQHVHAVVRKLLQALNLEEQDSLIQIIQKFVRGAVTA
ncbi:hypothetical protein BH10PSE19_BH10PSE19_18550 [soil metagenome]